MVKHPTNNHSDTPGKKKYSRQPDLLKHPASDTQLIPESASHERHICLFFLSLAELWQMLRPYTVEYMNAHAPVLYLHGTIPPHHLLDLLRAEGLPLEDMIARPPAPASP